MINKLYVINWCFILIWTFPSFGQTDEKYFILTTEVKTTPNVHGIETFYWLIPLDSIKNRNDFLISSLYVNDFSKDKVVDCIEGRAVDVFTASTKSDFSFSEAYRNDLLELKSIIYHQRKKVQKIRKKWSNGDKQQITFYLTPVSGEFCTCNSKNDNDKQVNISKFLSLPLSNFKISNFLWREKIIKEILLTDFSKFAFSNTL